MQTIPVAVYVTLLTTLLASIIAACVSFYASRKSANTAKEVAALAARSTQELKEKDYKNDYYKRVIDKRMIALDKAEKTLSLFSSSHIVGGSSNNERCHSYFVDNLDTLNKNDFRITEIGAATYSHWCSVETLVAMKSFLETVISTIVEVNKTTSNPGIKLILYSQHYAHINAKIKDVEHCIGQDMKTLYDVETYLRTRFA